MQIIMPRRDRNITTARHRRGRSAAGAFRASGVVWL